ncbi:MAG: glycosyltransferase family 39 protein [Anaerolineales bacterium]|nr:glycosyltransferase family 39 protein [Anaerolineales bacterium]
MMPIEDEAGRVARAGLIGLALLITGAGQLALQIYPVGPGLGLLLTAMGVLIFIGGVISPPPAWAAGLAQRGRLSTRKLMVLGAVALALAATAAEVAWQQLGRSNYLPVLGLWASACALYAAAFFRPRPAGDWLAWLRDHRWEAVALLGLVVLGGLLRFWHLGGIPRVIDGDEGRLGQFAVLAGRPPLANPFGLFENFGGLYMHTISLAVNVLGRTPLALRLAPAVGGTLAIPAVYLLGRYLLGPRAGLLAAGLLAISHAHVHFSRILAVAYIQETLFIPLELYFFISGLERRSTFRLALSGLLLGVHLGVYVSGQIVLALLGVYLLIALWLCRPLVQNSARQLWAFGLGFLVAGLPQLMYAALNPNEFFARLNADGTFQSGWLAATMAATGQSAPVILGERVAHAFLALFHYPALDFYGAGVPLLDVLTGTACLLGLAAALWHTRQPRFLLLNGYFWALTLAIGLFAVPPNADSYRMLVTLPAAVLLAAFGLSQAGAALGLDQPGRRWARTGVTVFLALALATLNIRTYYFDFAQRCLFGLDLPTRFASYLGNYLRGLNRDSTVYLLADDSLRYGTHASADFLSSNFPVRNYFEPAETLNPQTGVVIIAPPPRQEELKELAAQYPGGEFFRVNDCDNAMLLSYTVP